MTLSLALATAALLAAEPTNLPSGHPPVPPGTQASPATSPLPEGHPPTTGAAPTGELPAGHPPMSGTGRAPP
ncbi:MAG TPA: hypothetical protein VE153_30735, partial [Myxococcus sp.]|nr:hypothetical protein [Myxococcus sp.]